MPRNVRNFWMTAYIDGRETPLESGPRSKDGGMRIDLKIRDKGHVARSISIQCTHGVGNLLFVIVRDENGNVVHSQETER